jgi:hypothetical protein
LGVPLSKEVQLVKAPRARCRRRNILPTMAAACLALALTAPITTPTLAADISNMSAAQVTDSATCAHYCAVDDTGMQFQVTGAQQFDIPLLGGSGVIDAIALRITNLSGQGQDFDPQLGFQLVLSSSGVLGFTDTANGYFEYQIGGAVNSYVSADHKHGYPNCYDDSVDAGTYHLNPDQVLQVPDICFLLPSGQKATEIEVEDDNASSPATVTLPAPTGLVPLHPHGPSPVPGVGPGCSSSQIYPTTDPVLKTSQAIGDLGQVNFAGETVEQGGFTCRWDGKLLPSGQAGPYRQYDIVMWLGLRGFPNHGSAFAAYSSDQKAFGAPVAVPGLGQAASFLPGQDEVTSQLVVLSSNDLFMVSVGADSSVASQHAQLLAVAEQVLQRLSLAAMSAPAKIELFPMDQPVRSGGEATGMVTVTDERGKPVPDAPVVLQVFGNSLKAPAPETTNAAGQVPVDFTVVPVGGPLAPEPVSFFAAVSVVGRTTVTSPGALVLDSHASVTDAIGLLDNSIGKGCTASVLASANQSVLLTAGHCLFVNGHYLTDFNFAPDFWGEADHCPPKPVPLPPAGHAWGDSHCRLPFGVWQGTHPYVSAKYRDSGDVSEDFGLLVLNRSSNGETVQQAVGGGLTLGYNENPGQPWITFGYPLFKGPVTTCQATSASVISAGSGRQWNMSGCNMNDNPTARDEGASGGPWFTAKILAVSTPAGPTTLVLPWPENGVIGAVNSQGSACSWYNPERLVPSACKSMHGTIMGPAVEQGFDTEEALSY